MHNTSRRSRSATRSSRWLPGLLPAAVLVLAGTAHGFAPTGQTGRTGPTEPAAAATAGAVWASQDPAPRADPGKAIFQGKGTCFACHGREAGGTPLGPDLTDDEWINFEARPTPAEMEQIIRDGVAEPVHYPAPMPPMGGARLSDAEIGQLVVYVLSLTTEKS